MSAKLVRTAGVAPTLIVMDDRRPRRRRRRALEGAGCRIEAVRRSSAGLRPAAVLALLRRMNMTNVMIEGGGRVLGAFHEARLADEAFVFVAPRLIGGEAAPGPLGGLGPARVPKSTGRIVEITSCGPDLCYHLRFS